MQNKLLNRKLKQFKLKAPVAFVFNLNWKHFENFKLSQYEYIVKNFELRGINLTLLPIITNRSTHFEKRLDDFKNKIEKLCDIKSEKASVIAYRYISYKLNLLRYYVMFT